MADECSTPKAPRELRKKLKNGEITEAEFERQVAALRLTPADAATPDAPSSPARSLSRQFSELMDPEVKSLLSKTKLGKEKEVKEILSRNPGILKDAADMYGNTVLHLAALNGHKRIVKEVLRNSQHYDPYAVNKKGLSAADLARDFNYPELADYIREKLPGIPFAKAEAPSTEAAIDKKQGQLDEVSVELARVQAEREQLEREQQQRIQELQAATSRADQLAHSKAEQEAQMAKEVEEAKAQAEQAVQERLAAMEAQSKAEQQRLEAAFAEKMKLLEESNRKEQEERSRLAEEKAALEAKHKAAADAAKERERQEGKTQAVLNIAMAEAAKAEEAAAKERAEKNEAMAELALLKAQLEQAKRDQETAAREARDRFKKEQEAKDAEAAALVATQAARPRTDAEAASERDRLLSEFEERRKDLEAQQKMELNRQEKLLQDLLEIKRKKREAKLAGRKDAEALDSPAAVE